MAKKKWPKLPSLTVPLFQSARIYLCTSKDEWIAAEDYLGYQGESLARTNGRCRQFVDDEGCQNVYLIGVFDGRLSTLVHELAHTTFYCCDDVGVTVDPGKANETYCYLLDRMFSHFMPYIKQGK